MGGGQVRKEQGALQEPHMGDPEATTCRSAKCRVRSAEWGVAAQGRFMASIHVRLLEVFPAHEPLRIPLTRPSGALSTTGGEGRGEGVRPLGNRGTVQLRIGD